MPQTFHLPPAVPPPPVCADYFHLATPELSEADSDDFALVAEVPWSVAEWAVAPRFDNPRATVLVLVLG